MDLLGKLFDNLKECKINEDFGDTKYTDVKSKWLSDEIYIRVEIGQKRGIHLPHDEVRQIRDEIKDLADSYGSVKPQFSLGGDVDWFVEVAFKDRGIADQFTADINQKYGDKIQIEYDEISPKENDQFEQSILKVIGKEEDDGDVDIQKQSDGSYYVTINDYGATALYHIENRNGEPFLLRMQDSENDDNDKLPSGSKDVGVWYDVNMKLQDYENSR
jgi:hypothetical protein